MAYRRCLLIRGKLIDQKCHPSLSYLFHSDERICECPDEKLPAAEVGHLLQRRSFGSSINVSPGFAASSQLAINSNSFLVPCSGYSFCQYMSTINQGSNNIEFTSDVANVLTDKTLEAIASQAPILNEVAIASADSFLPVQALQYFIDYVHTYTGLNWWAAITLTTLLIRGATLPLLINQLKATSKLTLMRPHLEDIKQEMQDKAMDPMAVAEGQKKMKKLFNEYGVSPFTPLKGLFIQGPIFVSFFLACNMQEGMEGNPVAGTMKNVSRGLAVLTVPFTMAFPKAIFCYWVTSNLFSLVYGLGLKVPGVKKALGVPEIPAAAPTNTPQSPFSFFPALKKGSSATTESSSAPVVQSKLPGQKISSSSVISQRLRSLEKQVKGRKKNKKL
ncbi:mitochondrial inner membrane protein OXA1-like isoform X3 [Prosopis cineraria]|uniref:mitochondrial inner membrane protein OXA1-like isoform X3 n=1 Tax=Prosopis cineraria TaxID=364024 RepID=UPI00240FA1DE|nr:mitochondrial inner membrane protein OXA1-like isoform X3 [Prosopis cineraria]